MFVNKLQRRLDIFAYGLLINYVRFRPGSIDQIQMASFGYEPKNIQISDLKRCSIKFSCFDHLKLFSDKQAKNTHPSMKGSG